MAFRSQALFLAFAITASSQSFPVRNGGMLRIEDDGMTFVDKKHQTKVWTYEH